MDTNHIFKRTEDYVTYLFTQATLKMPYHNLEHTMFVVQKANEISGHYYLDEKDTLALFLASWFHDTGYLNGPAAEHELRSVAYLEQFATENEIDAEVLDKARRAILNTRSGYEPNNLVDQILKDADTYNLGLKIFKDTDKNVFKEWQEQHPEKSINDFRKGAYEMLKDHRYYTEYARQRLNDEKKKNMKKLKKKIDRDNAARSEPLAEVAPATAWVSGHPAEKTVAITEKAGTTKGMQTMLRLTSANHVQLSEMADAKANILISVNAIIISVILSVLLRKLQTDPYLTIPTLIFLTFAVVTIVLSILATRPSVNTGVFDPEDVVNKKTNLLFFGNFHKMSLQEYDTGMRTMMRDSDYLYSSMIKDIYSLGTVLGTKYKLIRWAYTIFMIGIVVSVIAFALFTIFYAPAEAPAASKLTPGSPF